MKKGLKIFGIACAILFLFVVAYIIGFNAQLSNARKNGALIEEAHVVSFEKDHLFSLINDYRASKDLTPFIKDEKLCSSAIQRLPELKYEIKTPHAGFYKMFSNVSYQVTENTTGAYSDQNALDRWLKSKPHRDQIESSWKYSCAVCSSEEQACVQLFANY